MTMSVETITEVISTDIRREVLQPGEMLPSERELCGRFGASRSQVRNAISNLGVLGLLDLSRGKRPRVAAPNFAKIVEGAGAAMSVFLNGVEGRAHLEQARLFLETSMMSYAAQHATSADIAKMVDAIEKCDASIDDVDAFREADVYFHQILAEIPGNPIFMAMHEAFVARLMRSRKTPGNVTEYLQRSNDEHREIVSAIMERDSKLAVAILTRHLERNYAEQFRLQLGKKARANDAET